MCYTTFSEFVECNTEISIWTNTKALLVLKWIFMDSNSIEYFIFVSDHDPGNILPLQKNLIDACYFSLWN